MSACDVSEISSPSRFTPHATRLGLHTGVAADMTTARPDGGPNRISTLTGSRAGAVSRWTHALFGVLFVVALALSPEEAALRRAADEAGKTVLAQTSERRNMPEIQSPTQRSESAHRRWSDVPMEPEGQIRQNSHMSCGERDVRNIIIATCS